MKKISYMLLGLFLCVGCESLAADNYIIDHTEYISEKKVENGFSITLIFESELDKGNGVVDIDDLLFTSETLYYKTGSQYSELSSVTVWISHSKESWNRFNELDSDPSQNGNYDDIGGVLYFSRDIDTFVVSLSHIVWYELDIKDSIRVYLHELMHYISFMETGDRDTNHANDYYWGKNGLIETVLLKVCKEIGC